MPFQKCRKRCVPSGALARWLLVSLIQTYLTWMIVNDNQWNSNSWNCQQFNSVSTYMLVLSFSYVWCLSNETVKRSWMSATAHTVACAYSKGRKYKMSVTVFSATLAGFGIIHQIRNKPLIIRTFNICIRMIKNQNLCEYRWIIRFI